MIRAGRRRAAAGAVVGLLGVAVAIALITRAGEEPPSRLEAAGASSGARLSNGAKRAEREVARDAPGADDETVRDRPLPLGNVDEDAMDAAMNAVRPLLQACRDEARKQHPEVSGSVIVELEIAAGEGELGVVKQGSVVDSDVQSPSFDACVVRKVAGLELPVPRGGGVVTIQYPFRLEPNEEFPEARSP